MATTLMTSCESEIPLSDWTKSVDILNEQKKRTDTFPFVLLFFFKFEDTYEGHHRGLIVQTAWFYMLLLNHTKLGPVFHQGSLMIKYMIRTRG